MNATMIIECPNCATKYKVVADAIKPGGRTVHCKTCSNKWHVEPTVPALDNWEERLKPDPFDDPAPEEAESEADAAPHNEVAAESFGAAMAAAEPAEPAIMAAQPQIASEPDHSHGAQLRSLALLAASVAVLAVGAFTLHGPIQRAWPASARLYRMAGMAGSDAVGQGLALKDVHAYLVQDGAAHTLNIEAQVVNTLKTPVSVPKLDATLIGANGPIGHWTFAAGTQPLDSGAATSVKASFDGANSENGKLLLTFSADNSADAK